MFFIFTFDFIKQDCNPPNINPTKTLLFELDNYQEQRQLSD